MQRPIRAGVPGAVDEGGSQPHHTASSHLHRQLSHHSRRPLLSPIRHRELDLHPPGTVGYQADLSHTRKTLINLSKTKALYLFKYLVYQ